MCLHSAPAAHLLAILCAFTALVLAALFFLHNRQCRHLQLADRPSTVGVLAALLSSDPKMLEALDPQDTNKEIEKKLDGWRFSMNKESWTIEAQAKEVEKEEE